MILRRPRTARAARQELEEADVEAAAERCDRVRHVALRPERESLWVGSLGERHVSRLGIGSEAA